MSANETDKQNVSILSSKGILGIYIYLHEHKTLILSYSSRNHIHLDFSLL